MAVAVGHIAKDQNHSRHIANRGSTVINRPLSHILGDQQRVVRQLHDHAVPQCAHRRAFDRLPSLLIDDLEHRLQQLPDGVLQRPTGQSLRHRIKKRVVATVVRGEYRIITDNVTRNHSG